MWLGLHLGPCDTAALRGTLWRQYTGHLSFDIPRYAMNVVVELRRRLHAALEGLVEDPSEAAALIRRSQDARFGDYQANCAMPLGKQLRRPPREVAAEIVERLDVADLCGSPEIAGPGFINFHLRDDWLVEQLMSAVSDQRLGIAPTSAPRTFVVDYSAPNVAKPMHVGHIRSTVIGDSLYRTLRFLGHQVISDNHIGDWGTQFGMILFGYQNFLDARAYEQSPVAELSRLYRLVSQLVEYHALKKSRPMLANQITELEANVAASRSQVEAATDSGKKPSAEQKKEAKALRRSVQQLRESRDALAALDTKLAAVENDQRRSQLAKEHPTIGDDVLAETAKLHAGDAQRRVLWEEFLPKCLKEIGRVYQRLGVTFDHTLGESFYHDRLGLVVKELRAKGLATESDDAVCVFLEGFDTPMIVQKKDGAYLYATTDLATIQYRMEQWKPDAILYVVDHRQSLHFEQLFATARKWGFADVELQHVSFGTVLGENGRPFKTRSGDTVGLESLLDEAVRRAGEKIEEASPETSAARVESEDRQRVAQSIGIAALKYADLSHNRTSDYVFSYDKMLALNGNTATYMQYAYARVRSIFGKSGVDPESLRKAGAMISIDQPAERALAVALTRFEEALITMVEDYRPNHLTGYLFELAGSYSTFFEQCPVIKADHEATRDSRLLLCDLTARTLKTGLALLGIDVVERM